MESYLKLKELYEKYHDPREHFNTYFAKESGFTNDTIIQPMKQCFRIFKSGAVNGDSLIRFGHSFMVHMFIPPSGSFREITAADHLDHSNQELKKWLDNDPDAPDWTEAVKYMCKLEGNSELWKEKQETVRRSVQQIVKCDVMKSNPLAPIIFPEVDCLYTAVYLEMMCIDMKSYRTALKNICCLLKPGGHLVMVTLLGCTFYMVGQNKFPCLCLNEEDVRQAISDAGCVTEEREVCPRIIHKMYSTWDYTDILYLVARKQKADQ